MCPVQNVTYVLDSTPAHFLKFARAVEMRQFAGPFGLSLSFIWRQRAGRDDYLPSFEASSRFGICGSRRWVKTIATSQRVDYALRGIATSRSWKSPACVARISLIKAGMFSRVAMSFIEVTVADFRSSNHTWALAIVRIKS